MIHDLIERQYGSENDEIANEGLPHWANNYLQGFENWKEKMK